MSPEAFWTSWGNKSNLRNLKCLLRLKLKEDCGKKAGAMSVTGTYVNLHYFFSATVTAFLIAAPELSFYTLPDFWAVKLPSECWSYSEILQHNIFPVGKCWFVQYEAFNGNLFILMRTILKSRMEFLVKTTDTKIASSLGRDLPHLTLLSQSQASILS